MDIIKINGLTKVTYLYQFFSELAYLVDFWDQNSKNILQISYSRALVEFRVRCMIVLREIVAVDKVSTR